MLRGDTWIIRLISGLFTPHHHILGADIAGTVESVGSKVSDFKSGDAVFGDIAGEGFGGLAEYVCVHEKVLVRKSSQMSFNEAAALPQAGLLAVQGLRYRGDITAGQQILINGAGGGVMTGNIISTAGVTFSTAGNAVQTVLNGRAISLVASVTMVNTTVNVP